MDKALLDHPAVIIASQADPSGELAKAGEVLPGDLPEEFRHICQKLEWH